MRIISPIPWHVKVFVEREFILIFSIFFLFLFLFVFVFEIESRCRFHAFENYPWRVHKCHGGSRRWVKDSCDLPQNSKRKRERIEKNSQNQWYSEYAAVGFFLRVNSRPSRCREHVQFRERQVDVSSLFIITIFFSVTKENIRLKFCVNRSINEMWYASRCWDTSQTHNGSDLIFLRILCVLNQNK